MLAPSEPDCYSFDPLSQGAVLPKLIKPSERLQTGVSIGAYAAAMAWVAYGGATEGNPWTCVAAYLLAQIALIGIWKTSSDRINLAVLCLGAVGARILLLPTSPNDDVFRYLWEGRVQNHGFNPYLLAPDNPILAPLRTAYWGRINHPDWSSIYFPFTQLSFRLVSSLGENVLGIKILAVLFDLGTLACLLGALREMGSSRRHALLYALNPMVLLYTAGEGHLESIFLFWIAAAIFAHLRGRTGLSFLALGFACVSNAKGLILLPLFLRRDAFKSLPFLLAPSLLWLPFASAGWEAVAAPFRFAGHFHFNGLVYNLALLCLPPTTALAFGALLLLLALAWIFILEPDPVRATFQAYFAFLLCAPTVHPWYLLPLAAGIVLYPAPHWGVWAASAAVLFPTYAQHARGGLWRESGFAWVIEYVAWMPVWAYFLLSRPASRRESGFPPPKKVSIIIPVFNERENIIPCIDAILSQAGPRPEIIVADGGSRDGTADLAKGIDGVRVVYGPAGRGLQISAGMGAALGDLLLIVHADSRLNPGSLARMFSLCESRPASPGGAFGISYTDPRFRFRLLASANNLRARFAGIAFGDQGQFFRREALEEGFPPYKLMEDVELSLRLKRHGSLLYIPRGVENSPRRWLKRGFLRNATLVIGLTAVFLMRRRLGFADGSGGRYHTRYYGNAGIMTVPHSESGV